MALTVQTNTAALTAIRHLNSNNEAMNSSLERLSSGFRINNAADDASGFAVSSKLDAQTERLKAASLNANQAQAMVKMADAGVNEIQNMVVRIQTLAVQAASSNSSGELNKLDAERIKLEDSITKISQSTNFNGVNLLSGNSTNGVAEVASQGTQAAVAANTSLAAQGVLAVRGVVAAQTASDASTTDVASIASHASVAVIASQLSVASTASRSSQASVASQDSAASVASVASIAGVAAGGTRAAVTSIGSVASIASQASNAAQAAVTAVASVAATTAVVFAGAQSFQVGADNLESNQVFVDLTVDYSTSGLGLGGGDLLTQANAQAYIDTAKTALNTIVQNRADLGSTQNQVAFIQANLATSIEQSTASVSNIRDADMAMEMAEFTKNQILTQASTAMLAQANQAAQNVMSLFR